MRWMQVRGSRIDEAVKKQNMQVELYCVNKDEAASTEVQSNKTQG